MGLIRVVALSICLLIASGCAIFEGPAVPRGAFELRPHPIPDAPVFNPGTLRAGFYFRHDFTTTTVSMKVRVYSQRADEEADATAFRNFHYYGEKQTPFQNPGEAGAMDHAVDVSGKFHPSGLYRIRARIIDCYFGSGGDCFVADTDSIYYQRFLVL